MYTYPASLVCMYEMDRTESAVDKKPLLEKTGSSFVNYLDVFVRPCFTEFLGVSFFTFIGCMSMQDALTVQNPQDAYVPSAPAVAIAHGLAITVLSMSFGPISGGHFNPAVTLGVLLAKGISPLLGLGYIIAQILGGMLGAAFCLGCLPADTFDKIYGGAHILVKVGPGRAILNESIITTIFVLTFILVSIDEKSRTKFAPLGIGFAETIGVLASLNLTGGSMNPARSLGPAVVLSTNSDIRAFIFHYVYWVGPTIGALLAASLYNFVFATRKKT